MNQYFNIVNKPTFTWIVVTLFAIIFQCNYFAHGQSNPLGEKARTINPLPGKALVYIFQHGIGEGIQIKINSIARAVLNNKQFYFGSFEPGVYEFSGISGNEDVLKLTLEPDKKYYIEAKADPFPSIVKLVLFDGEKGDKNIRKCRLFWMNVNDEATKMLDSQ